MRHRCAAIDSQNETNMTTDYSWLACPHQLRRGNLKTQLYFYGTLVLQSTPIRKAFRRCSSNLMILKTPPLDGKNLMRFQINTFFKFLWRSLTGCGWIPYGWHPCLNLISNDILPSNKLSDITPGRRSTKQFFLIDTDASLAYCHLCFFAISFPDDELSIGGLRYDREKKIIFA